MDRQARLATGEGGWRGNCMLMSAIRWIVKCRLSRRAGAAANRALEVRRSLVTTRFAREHRLIALAFVTWGWAAGIACAQAPEQGSITPSLASMKASVPVGDVVYVTDMTGVTIKGRLTAVTDESVKVRVRTDERRVPAAEIRRIQWQRPDSPLTGVLIGAAIGAVPGIYWLIVDPNECTGMCPEEYAAIGISAAVGGLIDHAIKKRVTVYAAPASSGRARSVTIGPLVMRHRQGVQLAVKW
jgi:hypothetical protein